MNKNRNDTSQAEQLTRKTHYWEKVGLVEYNPNKKKWEFRIDDCEAEIETVKKISPRRKNTILSTTLGPKRRK